VEKDIIITITIIISIIIIIKYIYMTKMLKNAADGKKSFVATSGHEGSNQKQWHIACTLALDVFFTQ